MLRAVRLLRCSARQGPFDPYKILGVTPGASKTEIKQAYHKLALRYHPDSGPEGNNERFAAVNEAYEAVKDGKWQPTAEQQKRDAGPGAHGWDPKYRTYTYEEPGSTTEAYVQGDVATRLRWFMVACFAFIFLRLFFFFAYPRTKQAVVAPLETESVHAQDENGETQPLVVPPHLHERYYGEQPTSSATSVMVDPLERKDRY